MTKKAWQINYGLPARCAKTGEQFFLDIFPSRILVGMCCGGPAEKATIRKLRVREALPDEKTSYWGWLENDDELLRKKGGSIVMIHSTRDLLEMCFPYGSKAAEEAGEGRAIRVVVEEVKR